MTATLAQPEDVAALLSEAAPLFIAIDFDGTLASITAHPRDAVLVDGAQAALTRLIRTTPVAISSGRPLDDLRPRFDGSLEDLGLIYVADHGAIIRTPDGATEQLVDPQDARPTLETVTEQITAVVGPLPGWQLERKDTSLAVHYRRVVDGSVQPALDQVRDIMQRHIDADPGFAVLEGKSVVEYRVATTDKGRALTTLAQQFSGRTPVAIGDDVTDEDAFAVARRLHGFAIRVGRPVGATRANLRLADPGAVVTMLRHLGDLLATDPAVDETTTLTGFVPSGDDTNPL